MLKKNIDVSSLDDLSLRLHAAINCLEAIHCAMSEGPFKTDFFVDALFASTLQLEALDRELHALYINPDSSSTSEK